MINHETTISHNNSEFREPLSHSQMVLHTAHELDVLQDLEQRNPKYEAQLAIDAYNYVQISDMGDFMMSLWVKANTMYKTPTAPPSIISPYYKDELRPPTRQEGDSHEVRTYFFGFHQGKDLGYEKELGNGWHLVFGSSEGFSYIPVGALEEVKGRGDFNVGER